MHFFRIPELPGTEMLPGIEDLLVPHGDPLALVVGRCRLVVVQLEAECSEGLGELPEAVLGLDADVDPADAPLLGEDARARPGLDDDLSREQRVDGLGHLLVDGRLGSQLRAEPRHGVASTEDRHRRNQRRRGDPFDEFS